MVSPERPDLAAERLADRLHSAAIHLLRGLRREDRTTGLGPARLSALSVLAFGGARTLRDLADAEQVRPPTMSRIVRGLERDGLVRRRPDPADGRAVRLAATSRGRRAVDRGRRRRVARLAAALAEIRGSERASLEQAADLLEEVARLLR